MPATPSSPVAAARWSASPRLPWPLPALLSWALAWGAMLLSQHAGLAHSLAWLLAVVLGVAAATRVHGRWRQLLVAAGFPLSSLVLGTALPGWVWLVAALLLVVAYPVRAWADAPFFPTPKQALQELTQALPVAPGTLVLDAGCGLGHGLQALQAAWPQAQLHGVEWSRPLALLAAWRCRFAHIGRGDMWVQPWSGFAVVYVFQRPESMQRAWRKACQDMAPGSWLVSLEFAVPGVEPAMQLDAGQGRPLWLYRVPTATGSKKTRHGR